MRTQPIGNRVLVELETMEQNIDGIYLPDFERDKINIGKVVELGTGKIEDGKQIPWTVNVGDKVIVVNTLDRITLHQGEHVYDIYRQDEIVGVINE